MKIIRVTAKSVVTQYGRWSRGQQVQVSDEFASHMVQHNLAEELPVIDQPAPFNKQFTPASTLEKKVTASNIGESPPSGAGRVFGSSAVGPDLTQLPPGI